jgi:peptidoglycan lytic transglycosylase G
LSRDFHSKKNSRSVQSKDGSWSKTLLIFLGILLWVPLVMGLVLYYLWAEVPYRGYQGPSIIVEVPHRSVQEILRLLQEKGVLREGSFGRVYLALTRRAAKLQAGEYLFEEPLTAPQVFKKLVKGDIFYHRVTVPEGLRSAQIFNVFIKEGFGSAEDFQREFLDVSRIADLDPEAADLEGYLFPDTYALARGTTAARIVDQMVQSHRLLWGDEWLKQARDEGFNIRQTVTLASLIEKETGQGQERGLISSVFHNRLREGMKLQCDPTIIYALVMRDRYHGVITRSDLHLDSRYNTYAYQGLPPGPIANPGREAIRAALFPESTDYLFFVSMNNGRHTFSTTLREHNQAVDRYQR